MPTLLHLEFSEVTGLGEELAYQINSGELLEALQAEVSTEILLWKLTLAEVPAERPYLSVEKKLVEQLIATYQEPEIFSDLLSELEQNPQLHPMLDQEFRSDVLLQLKEKITDNYRFRGAVDVD